jgi:hypothetical protein
VQGLQFQSFYSSPNQTDLRDPQTGSQHGQPTTELHVPCTSCDGRAGGAPRSPRRVPQAGVPNRSVGRELRSDTQELAQKLLVLIFRGSS